MGTQRLRRCTLTRRAGSLLARGWRSFGLWPAQGQTLATPITASSRHSTGRSPKLRVIFAFDAVFNSELIQQSYQGLSNLDFSSGVGVATFITPGAGMIAGPIDGLANAVTLGGKGMLQGGLNAREYQAKQSLLRYAERLNLSYEEFIETEKQLQRVMDGTYGIY